MPGGQQQSQTGDTGTTPMQQPQTDWQSIADAAASIPNALYVSRADYTDPGGASGRRALCSFIRSHRSCMAAVIAVLISLAAVGLAPLTFILKEEISQLSTTVDVLKRDQYDISTAFDALKRDQDDMGQLSTAFDALKRDQGGMSTAFDALKRDQDDLSTAFDALKRDQDDMRKLSTALDALKRDQDDMRQLSTTVDALKRDQDDMRQLSTAVDALKRDQDDMRQLSTTVDALKRDQDDMRQLSTTVDALKRDLDKERNRTAALGQRLHEMTSCFIGYTTWRGICYKAFNTKMNFSDAAATCGEDGGTLAMPRDAETNAFLISLYRSVRDNTHFWFGLHDQREEGSFEWVDGSALGTYNSWAPGEPSDSGGKEDCVLYSGWPSRKDKWNDVPCDWTFIGDRRNLTTAVQRHSDQPQ
ncbi:CD209 antigen-like [Branchiostoma lanceolatum]|uniref:CD209 antigen-like n=1 Tax=Branchiostoma lanceolatum TaxID=7740 RepID=UPI0034522904